MDIVKDRHVRNSFNKSSNSSASDGVKAGDFSVGFSVVFERVTSEKFIGLSLDARSVEVSG